MRLRLLIGSFLASLLVAWSVSLADVAPPPDVPPQNPNEQNKTWSHFTTPEFVMYDDELVFIEATGYYAGGAGMFTATLSFKNAQDQWELLDLWSEPINNGLFYVHLTALDLPIGEYLLLGNCNAPPVLFRVIERP